MSADKLALKTALQAGDLPAALPLARALLDDSPEDSQLRGALAKIHAALGQTARAVEVLQAGFEISAPPNDYFNFAYALRGHGAFRAAVDGYHKAIAAGLTGAEDAYINIAALEYEELGRADAAIAALEKALELKPASLPACLNLGNILEARGQFSGAEQVYARGLHHHPRGAELLARLVKLRGFEDANDPLLVQVKEELAGSEAAPEDAALLGFAYGDALNALGQFEDAYQSYAAANRAVPYRYDRRAAEAQIAAIKTSYPLEGVAQDTRQADSPAPVFICGMFRSGSTLLEQIIGAHPNITPLGELPFFDRAVRQTPALLTVPAASQHSETQRQLREAYGAQPAVKAATTPLFTDKRPDNFLYLGLIKRVFPKAKILHTRRDVRDIALSIFSTQLGAGQAYAQSLENTAHYVALYQGLMAHWQRCFGGDILSVDYEALTREPELVITRVLGHIGQDWDAACLSFYEAKTHVKTASYKQVRQKLHSGSVGRWRNYARYIEPHF